MILNLNAVNFATLSTLAAFLGTAKADSFLALLETSEYSERPPLGAITILNLAIRASRDECGGLIGRRRPVGS